MVNLILLFTFLGLALCFLGTVMLVFSLPSVFKINGRGELYLAESVAVGDEPDAATSGFFESLKLPFEVFKKRVIRDKDLNIILALVLLVLGSISQGYGVWLSVTDC